MDEILTGSLNLSLRIFLERSKISKPSSPSGNSSGMIISVYTARAINGSSLVMGVALLGTRAVSVINELVTDRKVLYTEVAKSS